MGRRNIFHASRGAEGLQEHRYEAAKVAGVPTPRTYDASTVSPEVQGEMRARAERVGTELPSLVRSDLETVERRLANPKEGRNESYQAGLEKKQQRLSEAAEKLADAGFIDTSVEGMTRNAQRALNRSVTAARQASSSEDGKLELPAGFDFYPEHSGAYMSIAKQHLDNPSETGKRLIMAATPFSAGAMPRVELQGASGLAQLHAGRDEYKVSIDRHAAKYLNEAAMKVKSGLPKEQRRQISEGTHSLSELPEEHAAVILQHQKKVAEGKNTHEALSNVKFSGAAQNLEHAAGILIGAAGTSGAGVVARGLRTMTNPQQFSEAPGTAGAWKVPTYGTTTLLHSDEHEHLSTALRHMVGAAVHGEQWWEQNPGAQQHVEKYMNHPAITNPHIVSDIHNARALTGLKDYDLSIAIGDRLRPESMFTRPQGSKETIKSQRRNTGIQVPDLGYLAQEEATRSSSLQFPMGGKKHELPAHAKQALIWYSQQAQSPENKADIKSGKKSVIHSVTQADKSKSLNPVIVNN